MAGMTAQADPVELEDRRMKITAVKPFIVSAQERNFFFVKVETDAGLYGLGEGGITWREQAMAEAVNALAPLLVGEDASRLEHLWQVMWRSGFFPAQRILGAAISAIDVALWDIRGKAFGVPVFELLGGRVRDRVVCYPHNGGRTIGDLVASCKRSADAGWKFVRWGVSDDRGGEVFEPSRAVRHTIAQCEAVRAALPEIEILIDVHTRLDPPDTIRLCREVERFHPFFIEDPLRVENLDALRQVRAQTAVPLAVGEHLAGKWEFRPLIEQEFINYARVDLGIVGGLTEARKVAALCEAHYIALAPHNPLGPVSAAACLHLCLAAPNFGVCELARIPSNYLKDVFPVQVELQAGHLLPPTRPGLGIEFDEPAAKAHPFKPGRHHRLRREDGSFTNW